MFIFSVPNRNAIRCTVKRYRSDLSVSRPYGPLPSDIRPGPGLASTSEDHRSKERGGWRWSDEARCRLREKLIKKYATRRDHGGLRPFENWRKRDPLAATELFTNVRSPLGLVHFAYLIHWQNATRLRKRENDARLMQLLTDCLPVSDD